MGEKNLFLKRMNIFRIKALHSNGIILLNHLIVSIFAYYNHKNNCLHQFIKALAEVYGYYNCFLINVNCFNHFDKQKW
jgi:hypothetical protein